MARIALSKLIIDEINKLKQAEKNWKKILIQYKSRIEKKRSWKEKQKFHKELEESIANLQKEKDNKDQDESLIKYEIESKKAKKIKIDKKELSNEDNVKNDDEKSAINKDKNEDDNEDQFDDDDDDSSIEIKSDTEDNEDLESDDDENNHKISDNEDTNDPSAAKIDKIEPKISNYKPNTDNLSKEIFIKQLNLDELTNLDEIPVTLNDNFENNEDNKETIKSTNKIIDPFFLSSDGKPQTIDTSSDYHSNNNYNNNVNNFDNDDYNGHNKRFRSFKSAFTNLSYDRHDRNSKFNKNDNRDYRSKNDDRWNNNNNFKRNNYNGDDEQKNRSFQRNNDSDSFKNKSIQIFYKTLLIVFSNSK